MSLTIQAVIFVVISLFRTIFKALFKNAKVLQLDIGVLGKALESYFHSVFVPQRDIMMLTEPDSKAENRSTPQ